MKEKTNRIRAVLFDFDGTLVNTTPLILRCFRATCEQEFGFLCADAEYISTFGIPLPTAMQMMIERCTADGRLTAPDDATALAEKLIVAYRSFNERWHDELIEPFAEIKETVQHLGARGLKLGIVSSKKRAGLERGLRLYAMTELFDVTLCAEETTHHKPHPEPLLRAMERLNVAPAETMYVGDSTHDLTAGRAAGVWTAAAAWGPFPRAELEALQPDYLLERPGELLRILQLEI